MTFAVWTVSLNAGCRKLQSQIHSPKEKRQLKHYLQQTVDNLIQTPYLWYKKKKKLAFSIYIPDSNKQRGRNHEMNAPLAILPLSATGFG